MEVRTTASSPTARSLIPVSATGDADDAAADEAVCWAEVVGAVAQPVSPRAPTAPAPPSPRSVRRRVSGRSEMASTRWFSSSVGPLRT